MELATRRETVKAMREQFAGISERRACGLLGTSRSSCRYKAKEQPLNLELTGELRTLALDKPRYGYRRLHVLLRQRRQENNQPAKLNAKRIHRLYRKAGLYSEGEAKAAAERGAASGVVDGAESGMGIGLRT